MTREEAKKILRKLLAEDEDIDFFSYDEKEAVNHFAYLPENKGDLISRQAVLARVRLNFTNHQTVERHEIEDIIKSEPSAENKGEWIPVTERLPKPEDKQEVRVIVSYENEDGEFVEKGVFNKRYGFNFPSVKAWQPLPEPYKEGGE